MGSIRPITVDEFAELVDTLFNATVGVWTAQADLENSRGAANRALVGALRWGVDRLREIQAQILAFPRVLPVVGYVEQTEDEAIGETVEVMREAEEFDERDEAREVVVGYDPLDLKLFANKADVEDASNVSLPVLEGVPSVSTGPDAFRGEPGAAEPPPPNRGGRPRKSPTTT